MTADADRRERLRRLGGQRRIIAGIALDHRDSLRVVLAQRWPSATSNAELRALKAALVRVLAPAATAVMLDEELGGQAIDEGLVPSWVGLIMPLEEQGYEAVGDGRTTALLGDFTPVDAIRRGATAAKLLVPYRVDHATSAAAQDATVASTVEACHGEGLPLIVEPVPYRWSSESPAEYAGAYRDLVVGAVKRLSPLGVDLFKLPFPSADGSAGGERAASAACDAMTAALAGIPWVLLGAGIGTETFLKQIRIAGTAGASGFLAGRGIWGAALAGGPQEVERLATATSLPAFEACRTAAERWARPVEASRG